MLEEINKKTYSIISVWDKYSETIASDVWKELSKTSFEMIEIMTSKLSMWENKKLDIGDKVLFYTCIGSIVEAWLRFFYCVYHKDYDKEPYLVNKKNGKISKKSRNSITFCEIIKYSIDKIFKDKNDSLYLWVENMRNLRNSIHIFNIKDFSNCNYSDDLKKLDIFIDKIWDQLPPIEDAVDEMYGDWNYR